MRSLTVGSLFSGIGGGDLGMEQAGFALRWQCEVESFPRRVLGAHWPGVPCYEDVQTLFGKELERVDCVIFGSPCQDLSIAGRRAGLMGRRSGLFFDAVRGLEDVLPTWIVFENVPGLLSSRGGRDFLVVLDSLEQLGYGLAWRVLDSQHFRVAQRRRRVYVVGCLGDPTRAGQVLFEREGRAGDSAASGTPGADVARTLTAGTGGSSGKEQQHTFLPVARTLTAPDSPRYDGDTENFVVSALTTKPYADNEAQEDRLVVAATLTGATGARSNPGGRRRENGENLVAATLKQRGRGATDEVMDNLQVAYALRSDPGGTGQGHNTNYVTHALTAEGHDASEDGTGRGTPIVIQDVRGGTRDCTDHGQGIGISEGGPCYTLGATERHGVATGGDRGVFGVRRLTPRKRECERLQGFPDGWTAIDGDKTPDSPRYRALGNAMTVNVTRWIGRRILAVAGDRPC